MSDLDDEELEATRRINGVAKEINIEKDIKRCEQLTKPEHANWIGISNQLAIAHLIEKIKELEEENENKENKIWQLKETIQNLENECISLHELIDGRCKYAKRITKFSSN